MDVGVDIPVLGQLLAETPREVVLRNQVMKSLLLDVSKEKQYVNRMSPPPVVYVPDLVLAQ